ncbi:MAG TPA: diacylglycerol kinase family protein [Solirubrobacteraceae bacterium]|nr:diacylglycerol kinase family protein [Solirubrobacteraceae bacterium]
MTSSAAASSFERLDDTFSLTAPAKRRRMLVVVNPYATTVSDRLKGLVVHALNGRYEVEAVDTQRRDHATDLCREAAQEGYDVVVGFGGDGTLNEVANGLAGCDTPLACLPGGATNVLCRMLGIPDDIVDATEHLLRIADRWEPRRLDLAKVNERHFTFSAGMGLDAAVVERVDARPRVKARWREWYFAYAGLSTFLRRYVVNPPRLRVRAGGQEVDGVTAIVQNGDPFSFFGRRPLHVCDAATLDDGRLSAVLLRRASPVDMPTVLARLFGPMKLTGHRRVSSWSGLEGLEISSIDGRPVHLQVDGDHIGEVTEARFSILPGGLSVVA